MKIKTHIFILIIVFSCISFAADENFNVSNEKDLLLDFSCLSDWKNLPLAVEKVNIEPDDPQSPFYEIKNPKYYYANFPESCNFKSHDNAKLLILMQDENLLKMEFKFFNKEPKFLKKFDHLDQLNIDKAFGLDGMAYYFAKIKIKQLYEADYLLQLARDEYFEERFTIISQAMFEYE